VTVYESDLPGVGKKHELELDDGSRLVVVTHNTGKREVFRRTSPDADAEKLFELDDELARQVGTVLEGAYFQPVESDVVETALGEGTVIEWATVGADSPVVGQTLGEMDLRRETGATVVAVQRADRTVPSPGADTRIEAGDTLVAVGERDACRRFRARVTGESEADDERGATDETDANG
jgi:TrkA domain protein